MIMTKIDFRVFNLLEDGLYSSEGYGEGRLIPVVVIDFSQHKVILELIDHHNSIDNGDVTLRWITNILDKKSLILKVNFSKPITIEFGINFNTLQSFNIIDAIIQSRGLIIQNGKKGDKPSRNFKHTSLMIEVPNLGFDNIWEKKFHANLESYFRKKRGLSKKEAIMYTKEHIKQIRELLKIRQK